MSLPVFFKEFQISASFKGLVKTVPGVNVSLLKTDRYVMNPEKDTILEQNLRTGWQIEICTGAKNNSVRLLI